MADTMENKTKSENNFWNLRTAIADEVLQRYVFYLEECLGVFNEMWMS